MMVGWWWNFRDSTSQYIGDDHNPRTGIHNQPIGFAYCLGRGLTLAAPRPFFLITSHLSWEQNIVCCFNVCRGVTTCGTTWNNMKQSTKAVLLATKQSDHPRFCSPEENWTSLQGVATAEPHYATSKSSNFNVVSIPFPGGNSWLGQLVAMTRSSENHFRIKNTQWGNSMAHL